MKKYVIVGGVAGGASTAARLRRMDEKAQIILVEKGAYVSYANCGLPYYIGDVIQDRNKLFVQTAAGFQQRFNIDVRILSEVTAIDTEAQVVTIKNLITDEIYTESYHKLVLSPGADPIRPPLDGISSKGIFTLRNVADTDKIKAYVSQFPNGKAIVIGAGFIGLEMAENFHHLGMDVTIIEMANQVMAPVDFATAAIAQQHIRSKGVDLRLKTQVVGFEEVEGGVRVFLKEEEPLEANIVILSIGVRPDNRLAKMANLEIGKFGGIIVNEYLQTSNPDVYAVGDAIEFTNPITGSVMPTYLAGPANKQGRICANNIVFGNNQKYNGSINTAIAKVFDLTIATAGVASKHLTAAGIEHLTSFTHSGSHAGYYPNAELMSIELAYSPNDGRLYGAQVVGRDGVDKRIDILSSVIQRGSTIYELMEFEHAYAPPYSSAKDPVNMAGFVADNVLSGKLKTVCWDKVFNFLPDDYILDVRSNEEFEAGHIPNAIHISIDELRHRLDEIPRDRNIFLYCQVGIRGYMSRRILMQNGFDNVYNISGGYYLWNICNKELQAIEKTALAVAL